MFSLDNYFNINLTILQQKIPCYRGDLMRNGELAIIYIELLYLLSELYKIFIFHLNQLITFLHFVRNNK